MVALNTSLPAFTKLISMSIMISMLAMIAAAVNTDEKSEGESWIVKRFMEDFEPAVMKYWIRSLSRQF